MRYSLRIRLPVVVRHLGGQHMYRDDNGASPSRSANTGAGHLFEVCGIP
jgi:hypothetical protein